MRSCLAIPLLPAAIALAACGGSKTTTLVISNKISSLPAGQSYVFQIAAQHTQGLGATWALNGQGTLVSPPPSSSSATYIAPPTPTTNSVTVTATAANGSGVSDSDSFTISPASGPVVSISPATFTVTGHGSPVTLSISVTQDNPSDVLTASVTSSTACGGPCGSFGTIMGTHGGGTYTVQFSPPTTVTQSSLQTIQVSSNLLNSTPGLAFPTLNPG